VPSTTPSTSTKRVEHQEDRDAAELAGPEEDALSAVEVAPGAAEPAEKEERVAEVDLEEVPAGGTSVRQP